VFVNTRKFRKRLQQADISSSGTGLVHSLEWPRRLIARGSGGKTSRMEANYSQSADSSGNGGNE